MVEETSAFAGLSLQVWLTSPLWLLPFPGNSLLLIPVGLGFAGGVIGLGKRLMGTGRPPPLI